MFKKFNYLYFSIFLCTQPIFLKINAQKHPQQYTHPRLIYVAGSLGDVTENNIYFFLVRMDGEKSRPNTWIKQLGDGWYIVKKPFDSTRQPNPFNSVQEMYPANNLWKFENGMLEKYMEKAIKFPFECLLWIEDSTYKPYDTNYIGNNAYPVKKIKVENLGHLEKLLQNEKILYIGQYTARNAAAESSVQRYDPSANEISLSHRWYPEIKGKGMILSIKENRFDTADADLKNRWFLTAYSSQATDLHATEISSLAAGSGNTGKQGKGVAHGTRLTSASFQQLLPEPPAYYKNNQISVQNHSYGTGIENEYATDAASYDLLSWLDSGLLHVFSAGNQGNGTPGSGTYTGITGFNNLTGSFKMSKNSLVMGATDSFHRVEALSSRGPAYDGRVKPELVAFGTDGTSGSAALTSGTALLVQQALKEKTGVMPPSSLVKAVLIGSARDIGSEGPDYLSGYGRLDTYRAVSLAQNNQFFTGSAVSAKESLFELTVPENTRYLKITLTWTDTSATPSSSLALVNDLDLILENKTSGELFRPWILSRYPHPDSLLKPAIRGTDHINNTEQIGINNPMAGTYKIKVSPFSVSTRNQPFSIVYTLERNDTFYCSYPSANDYIPASTAIPIRWQQSFEEGTTINIDYSFANQTTWQNIATATMAAANYHYWNVPDTNAVARIRFTIAGKTFFSDSIFITGNPKTKPGYVCEEGALLVWQPLKKVAKYHIYTLADTLMKQAGSTTDTVFFLPASLLKNKWVAISAEAAGNPGLETRFPSFNIFTQGINCYFKSFLTEWNNGEAILDVSLGTNYGIKSLSIQKSTGGTFTNLQTISPIATTVFSCTDRPLSPGAHTYKVVLTLTNGSVIESERQTIIQPGPSGWWVYPNPAKRGSPLKILNRWSETKDLFVILYNAQGRKTGTYLIPLIDNTIPVTNLAAGMYFLVFTDGKKQLGTQKLMVMP